MDLPESGPNVAAGQAYGLPLAGTMAHSYIQAHDDEFEAFRTFARRYPDTVLLVDTYDTLRGVQKVIDLAQALGYRRANVRNASASSSNRPRAVSACFIPRRSSVRLAAA